MKTHSTLLLLFFYSSTLLAQINPNNITIVRDGYGVPHIYAATDAEVAYGLAWAHAEDDFNTIQLAYLAGNALLSRYNGKAGAPADFVSQFIQSKELIEVNYSSTISAPFKKVLEGYATGLNAYAKAHPEEVLEETLFPVNPKKMLRYAQLQLFISSNGDRWINAILGNRVRLKLDPRTPTKGSNTFAFNSKRTTDGATYLAINTHQPLNGPVSWYEVHLHSEEDTNILGALFPGSPVVFIGANENLAWSHTVNNPDKTDVFALEMHPKNKLQYRVDSTYYTLEKHKAKIRIKLLGIPIGISKTFYKSIYGPALKNKHGYYAIRTPILNEIGALEQWWHMNKANNFSAFYKALKRKSLPGYNIGYADKNDTIFYISNGLIPKRADGYKWEDVVPGNKSKTLWKNTYPIEELPQVIQPKSGFVYNANHAPFFSSAATDNPQQDNFNPNMGFETFHNNRSTRLKNLIDQYPKLDFEDFKTIKYDKQYPQPFQFNFMNINGLYRIDAARYPDIQHLIERLQNWDKKATANSLGAATFALFYAKLGKYFPQLPPPKIFPNHLLVQAIRDAKDHMLKHFKTTELQLGEVQKLVRGGKEYPIFGLPDVITAMHAVPYKDGKREVVSGESYISLVRFTADGPEIESVMAYGNSDKPNSPHFDDQIALYQQGKTKKMSLDKAAVMATAKKVYHPK